MPAPDFIAETNFYGNYEMEVNHYYNNHFRVCMLSHYTYQHVRASPTILDAYGVGACPALWLTYFPGCGQEELWTEKMFLYSPPHPWSMEFT